MVLNMIFSYSGQFFVLLVLAFGFCELGCKALVGRTVIPFVNMVI